MPWVEVQHPTGAQWIRHFTTIEEAENYIFHVTNHRGCSANLRTDACLCNEPTRGELLRDQQERKALKATEEDKYL